MSGLGSGVNGQWTFLDIIALLSFAVGLENLDVNITQTDLQNEAQVLDERMQRALAGIHAHLEMQDEKLKTLLGGAENEH